MEERLAVLKNLMTAEKASRRYVCNSKPRPDMICVVNSAASSAYWASGQKGPLKKSYAAEQRKAPPVSYPRLWAYTKHPIKGLRQIASPALCYLQKTTKIRILTDTNAGSPKIIPLCDKCSKYRPSVVRARDRCCMLYASFACSHASSARRITAPPALFAFIRTALWPTITRVPYCNRYSPSPPPLVYSQGNYIS